MAPRFVLVAGETSGDRLGGALIGALRDKYPRAEFAGVGGPEMRAQGLECWHDCQALAVMGLAEVVAHLPRLLRLRRALKRRVLAAPPDCFIGIDAPDFNFPLERRFKKDGIKTVHYVSPSIWAWRQQRARRIGRDTDLILTLFPFEAAIYRRHHATAEYVGHPAAEGIPVEPDRSAARRELELADDCCCVALLPGSRLAEIKRLGEIFSKTAALLAERRQGVVFVAPCANPATRTAFQKSLARHATGLDVRLLEGRSWAALTAADATLVASGTAALEAMLCKTPMVVAYRIAPITYFIVKSLGLLKIERYSLPNVLSGEELVPELMQNQATPAALAEELAALLEDTDRRRRLLERFAQLHQGLRGGGATRAATAIAALLERR